LLDQVLVCLEGSPSSRRAVEQAIEIARDQQAALAALPMGGPESAAAAPGWIDDLLRRCQAAGVTGRVIDQRPVTAERLAERIAGFDLTVVGRDAHFEYLHSAARAVLLVPDTAPVRSPRVMAAFDGSSASLRAIRAFAESGLGRDAEVHVVCVDDNAATARELATRGVQLFQDLGLHAAAVTLVSAASIATALLEASDRIAARLIVMGAYPDSKIAELLWGSVTRTLTQQTRVPLFLHH
jgi:nucleotide-binding universal stress UspA family protein